MRHNGDLDPFRIARAAAQAHILINKADKGLYSVQKGLNV